MYKYVLYSMHTVSVGTLSYSFCFCHLKMNLCIHFRRIDEFVIVLMLNYYGGRNWNTSIKGTSASVYALFISTWYVLCHSQSFNSSITPHLFRMESLYNIHDHYSRSSIIPVHIRIFHKSKISSGARVKREKRHARDLKNWLPHYRFRRGNLR